MSWINPWSGNVENSNRKYSYTSIRTKEQVDILLNQGDWKSSIQTFDDISISYPEPIEGWVVPIDSSQIIYYYNGVKWEALFGDSDSMKLVVPSTKILRNVDKEKFDKLTADAPTSIDTFKEVADALGNDSNFATTILSELNNRISSSEKNVPNGVATLTPEGNIIDANGNKMVTDQTKYKQVSEVIQSGEFSNAEGSNTIASGPTSHSEGSFTEARGLSSHTEGTKTLAIGSSSHAEGLGNISAMDYSHTEGLNNSTGYSIKISSIDVASNTITTLDGSDLTKFAVGDTVTLLYFSTSTTPQTFNSTIKSITGNIIELNSFPTPITTGTSATRGLLVNTKQVPLNTSIWGAHAEGVASFSYGLASHVEGLRNMATANGAHAEGYGTSAISQYAHSEGNNTVASGMASHSEGVSTTATGNGSHAEGQSTTASGNFSHSGGYSTIAGVFASTAIGQYNSNLTGSATSFSITNDAFAIGNGSSITSKSNAFRINFNGSVYALSAFNSTGADYAEYFEWEDGNINNEDRIGYFVTLEGDKIRIANSNDEYIIGVISSNPSVVGDSFEDGWNNRYLKDNWGRVLTQEVFIPAKYEQVHHDGIIDKEGNIVSEEWIEEVEIYPDHIEIHNIINPEWINNEQYIPRSQRKEWSPVGIVGKLLVRDDGTCQVNGYCKPNNDGIATSSPNGYRVMERISDNIIKLFIK